MKKVIVFCAIFALLALFTTSCNVTCECTETHEDPSIPTEIYDVTTDAGGVRKCSDLDQMMEDASGRTYIKCVKKSN